MSSPQEWFDNIPPVTKTYMVSTFAVTVANAIGVINPLQIYLEYSLIAKLQLWRLITSFLFFGKFSFNWMISMYLLYTYSSQLEKNFFQGREGKVDYIFCLLFCALFCSLISLIFPFLNLFFLGQTLVSCILYIWSRKSPFNHVLIFAFRILSWQLPFMYIVLDILMGQSPVHIIVGIAVGHLYHFLSDIFPKVYGKTVLKSPKFLYDLFGASTNTLSGRWFNRGRGHRVS